MGLSAIKLRAPNFDKELHYRGIKSKITTIKKHWPGNEKIIQSIISTYEGMIVNLSERIASIFHVRKDIDEVIETVKSFFIQLLWEYDLDENVDFTTYLRDHLFYRVKNYYEKQNGTSAYLETRSSGTMRRSESGSNDDLIEKDHKIRCCDKSMVNRLQYNWSMDSDDLRANSNIRRSVASDTWKGMLREFDEDDIDLIICSYLLKMKQSEISGLFGKTQPRICGIRKNIVKRMRKFVGE